MIHYGYAILHSLIDYIIQVTGYSVLRLKCNLLCDSRPGHILVCVDEHKIPQILTTDNDSTKPSSTSQEQLPTATQTAPNLINTALSHPQPTKVYFLKTAVAMMKANRQYAQVNILLDEGAQHSFITQGIADHLYLNHSLEERKCCHCYIWGIRSSNPPVDQHTKFQHLLSVYTTHAT